MIYIHRSITEWLLQKMTSHKHKLWPDLFWRMYIHLNEVWGEHYMIQGHRNTASMWSIHGTEFLHIFLWRGTDHRGQFKDTKTTAATADVIHLNKLSWAQLFVFEITRNASRDPHSRIYTQWNISLRKVTRTHFQTRLRVCSHASLASRSWSIWLKMQWQARKRKRERASCISFACQKMLFGPITIKMG